jgi:hypothetical protein
MSDGRYTQEQVNAILKRALQRKEIGDLSDDLSHRELLETAKEVGIDPRDVEQAIAEERRAAELRADAAEWKAERAARLRAMATTWAAINALCTVINFVLGPPWWFLWVLIPWGTILLLSALRTRNGPSPHELTQRRERRLRKQRNEEIRARIQTGAQVIGDVVEQGVSLLLNRLEENRRLRDGRGPDSRRIGDYDGNRGPDRDRGRGRGR